MHSWWKPTKGGMARAAVLACVLPLAIVLMQIPHQWDVLDLRLLGRGIVFVLIALPIRALDAVTGSAFAPRSEGFLAFPSAVQAGFALGCYAVACCVLGCLWDRLRRRSRPAAERADRTA